MTTAPGKPMEGAAGAPAGAMDGMKHRMAKKIAQLTKVIYHLNNRNEDHALALRDVEDQYEGEIASILGETASRLKRFQQELRMRDSNNRVAQVAKQLEEERERDAQMVSPPHHPHHQARARLGLGPHLTPSMPIPRPV